MSNGPRQLIETHKALLKEFFAYSKNAICHSFPCDFVCFYSKYLVSQRKKLVNAIIQKELQ